MLCVLLFLRVGPDRDWEKSRASAPTAICTHPTAVHIPTFMRLTFDAGWLMCSMTGGNDAQPVPAITAEGGNISLTVPVGDVIVSTGQAECSTSDDGHRHDARPHPPPLVACSPPKRPQPCIYSGRWSTLRGPKGYARRRPLRQPGDKPETVAS